MKFIIIILIIVIIVLIIFLKIFRKWFIQTLFSKEVIAASIAACVLIVGYNINAENQRKHEIFVRKLQTYETLLSKVEILLPECDPLKSVENIKELNSAQSNLFLEAPDNVLKRILNEVIVNRENPFNRDSIKKLQLILHQDLYPKSSLTDDDFPFFYLDAKK